MNLEDRARRLWLRAGGACALLVVVLTIAGALTSSAAGLGGQALPLGTAEGLARLAERLPAYRLREALYVLLALFAIGEGLGLHAWLRDRSPVAGLALVLWLVGLGLAVAQDALAVAAVEALGAAAAAPGADLGRLAELGALVEAAVRWQRAAANALVLGGGLGLFALALWRTRASRPLAVLAGVAALLAGVVFPAADALAPGSAVASAGELGFAALLLFDAGVAWRLLPDPPAGRGPESAPRPRVSGRGS